MPSDPPTLLVLLFELRHALFAGALKRPGGKVSPDSFRLVEYDLPLWVDPVRSLLEYDRPPWGELVRCDELEYNRSSDSVRLKVNPNLVEDGEVECDHPLRGDPVRSLMEYDRSRWGDLVR